MCDFNIHVREARPDLVVVRKGTRESQTIDFAISNDKTKHYEKYRRNSKVPRLNS